MLKSLLSKISPEGYYKFTSAIIPWLLTLSLFFISYGLYQGLFVAPPDYQQGDAFRIMYVHVPSAWISLFAYSVVFFSAIVSLIWHVKVISKDIKRKVSILMLILRPMPTMYPTLAFPK